jgi:hypothetical protein
MRELVSSHWSGAQVAVGIEHVLGRCPGDELGIGVRRVLSGTALALTFFAMLTRSCRIAIIRLRC